MLPIRDNQLNRTIPWVTYALIGLNCFIYLWDRQFHLITLQGPGIVFADLVMRPREVVDAMPWNNVGDRFALVTIFTSLFLHGNLMHLIGNMIFLLTFGAAIEEGLGGWKFVALYVIWGYLAAATHIFVDPQSLTPTLGASGAIGGVLGCYFLLYPSNKIEVLVPILFTTFVASAWLLLAAWFLWQVLVPQTGVATWAHVGGFLAGMLTVLFLGGRSTILKNSSS